MISTDTSANVIHDEPASHEWTRVALQDARNVALSCVGIYLAVSGAVLIASGHSGVAAAHVVVIAIAAWAMPAQRGARLAVGDLLPLFIAPALYMELPLLIAAGGATYHDPLVQGWEVALFHGEPSRTFAVHVPFTWLSEILHAGYLCYYAVIFVPPLVLYARRERQAFSQTVLALTITCLTCWVLFVVFPVQGPRYLWAGSAPDGPVRRFVLRVLASGSSRGAAFPSSHMAVSVAQTIMAWRWQRRLSYAAGTIAMLVGVGAVYGGFHYGIDMIAGTVLAVGVAAAIIVVCDAPSRSFARE